MPPRTILVVDDQHGVCVSLAYFLELAGYRVLTAESGPSAVALAEKEVIDGAVIDVHMPVVNGFDTCLRLQSQAGVTRRELRVWFMTGACTSELERRGVELGALGVFRKPFDSPSFLEQLEHGFASARPEIQTVTEPIGSKGENDSTAW